MAGGFVMWVIFMTSTGSFEGLFPASRKIIDLRFGKGVGLNIVFQYVNYFTKELGGLAIILLKNKDLLRFKGGWLRGLNGKYGFLTRVYIYEDTIVNEGFSMVLGQSWREKTGQIILSISI
jgi:hypothetical protein